VLYLLLRREYGIPEDPALRARVWRFVESENLQYPLLEIGGRQRLLYAVFPEV
jgi:hypothetical protein